MTGSGGSQGTYRFDAMGNRVKRTWNYTDPWGTHSGSAVDIYGPSGDLLVEYLNDNGGPSGFVNTTTYHILMGNQTVARRVVGSSGSLNPPLPRTEWLHRNHLNQVVAVDMVKDFLTMYGTITGYSQPYNSGGSDQFQGHKDDSETGLHYNLARSYSPAVARWVSADSVTAFVYHPHSLNKSAYVRNNPIGLVDRDGHDASRADYPGDCVEVNEWLPPPLVGGGIGGNRHGVLQPFRVVDGGGSGGLGVTPVRPTGRQLLQDRLNRKNTNQATPCRDFLDALIARLGSQLPTGFSVDQLIENIMNAQKQVTELGEGHYEHVEGNTIQIDPNAFERHYFTLTLGETRIPYAGDVLSTLLHAGFHLLSSAATAQITDTDLYEQTSRFSGLSAGAASGLQSAAVGAAFAKYCGADILQRYP